MTDPEPALRLAYSVARNAQGDTLEFIERWIDLMETRIADDRFEQSVETASAPRLKLARKLLPSYALKVVEDTIRDQERRRLKS